MMTLQQFIKLHPNIIQYDRAGTEGIDFDALHERIINSRYLKSRQSFIFFAKNYKRILNGDYDDFKLVDSEIKIDPKIEEARNKTKMRLSNVKLFISKISECNFGELEDEFLKKAKECKSFLEQAVEKPAWSVTASVMYNDLISDLRGVLGWVDG